MADETTEIPRRAREWYPLSHPVIEIPDSPPVPSRPSNLLGVTSFISVVGVGLVALVMVGISGTQSMGGIAILLGFGVLTGITTFITSLAQRKTYKDQLKKTRKAYEERLNTITLEISEAEKNARVQLLARFPPFARLSSSDAGDTSHIMDRLERPGLRNDIDFWSRSPEDNDFLSVRLGTGRVPAPFEVKGAVKDAIILDDPLKELNEQRQDLIQEHRLIDQSPLSVNLAGYSCVAILTDESTMANARELLRGIAGQAAYWCGPDVLRMRVMSSDLKVKKEDQPWDWVEKLPHTHIDAKSQEEPGNPQSTPKVGLSVGPEAASGLLALIAGEVDARRAQIRAAEVRRQESKTIRVRPHLLLLVDHFPEDQSIESKPLNEPQDAPGIAQLSDSAPSLTEKIPVLRKPELAAALTDGIDLSITTVCICADRNSVPEGCGLLIDLRDPDLGTGDPKRRPMALNPSVLGDTSAGGLLESRIPAPAVVRARAKVVQLRPEPDKALYCHDLDYYPVPSLDALARGMNSLKPPTAADRDGLPQRLSIRELFPDELKYGFDPQSAWDDYWKKRQGTPSESQDGVQPIGPIPIGQRLGRQTQYLDLNNDKDRAHGMIAGQTGAGKSVLLQTIITAFAMTHSPAYMNFLLVDFKSGLALERFAGLPHTIGFLTDVNSTAQIQRFVEMVHAERRRRGDLIQKWNDDKSLPRLPRLLIVVDEFAEMASANENAALLDDFVSVLRLGRELGMHLLVTGQRPEGKMASRVMDLVQYRLCLRMNEDDSKAIIGRPDAANLPTSIQGRCYMQHGDNQLDLFQAATTRVPIP